MDDELLIIDKELVKHGFNDNPVWKTLLIIAVPIIILMISNSLYVFIDSLLATIFVPDINPTDPAISINGGILISLIIPYALFLFSFSLIFVVGFSLYYPKRIGQNKLDSAKQGVGQAMLATTFVSILLIIFVILTADPYVTLLINNSTIESVDKAKAITEGSNYLKVISIAVLFISFTNILSRGIRAEGHNVASAAIPIIPIPINLFFDWFFMKHLGMGISGGAIATDIAAFIALVIIFGYVLYLKRYKVTYLNFNLKYWRPIKQTLIVIGLFGMITFIRRISTTIIVITISFNLSSLHGGDLISWTTIFTSISRTGLFINKVALGVTQAAAVLFAFYLGAKDHERIRATMKWSIIYTIVIESIVMIILIGSSYSIIKLFLPNDPAYINSSGQINYLWLYLIAFCLGLLYIFINSFIYVIAMFFAATRNIKAILIQSAIIMAIIITFSIGGWYFTNNLYDHHNPKNPYLLLIYFVIVVCGAGLACCVSWYRFWNKYRFEFQTVQEISNV